MLAAELDICCTSKVLGTFIALVANYQLVQDARLLRAWHRYLVRDVLRLTADKWHLADWRIWYVQLPTKPANRI